MRIATWNLQRPKAGHPKNAGRLAKIAEVDADIWILTETDESVGLNETHYSASTELSPRKKPRPTEACATIWSRWPTSDPIPTYDRGEAVCVEVMHPERKLIVYGCIIPWDGYRGPDGNSPKWHEHYRFIQGYAQDWLRLTQEYPDHEIVIGGDFNQNRDGVPYYGTETGRQLLTDALNAARLACVTEENFVKIGKLQKKHLIDHICVRKSGVNRVTAVEPWDPNGLSDHRGVCIELV